MFCLRIEKGGRILHDIYYLSLVWGLRFSQKLSTNVVFTHFMQPKNKSDKKGMPDAARKTQTSRIHMDSLKALIVKKMAQAQKLSPFKLWSLFYCVCVYNSYKKGGKKQGELFSLRPLKVDLKNLLSWKHHSTPRTSAEIKRLNGPAWLNIS